MASDIVLVTGGTGLIGSYVARSLVARGLRPVLLDLSPSRQAVADLGDRVDVEKGDVTSFSDLAEVCVRHKVNRIVHLAAMLSVQSAVQPARTVMTNCVATSQIIQLGRMLRMDRVVFASSASVYARRAVYEAMLGRSVVDEDDPPIPFELYGATKYLCETLGAQAFGQGQDVVGLRPVLTYGYGQFTGAVGYLNDAVRDIARSGAGHVRMPWSRSTYVNPMYVEDCADAIAAVCLWKERFSRPCYNLGTGEYCTIGDMMAMASASVGGAQVGYDEDGGSAASPPAGYDFADLDSRALRDETGWRATYDVQRGVEAWVGAYRTTAGADTP